MKIDNRKDILLLFLYSPGITTEFNEPIVGRTKLVKGLFLFKEEALDHFKKGTHITKDNFYEFFAWDFGPFSKEIYDDITFFILNNFICTRASEQESLPEAAAEWNRWVDSSGINLDDNNIWEYQEEEFTLSEPKGITFTKELYNSLSDSQKKILKEFKSKIISSSLRAIIRYVYKQYPDLITKSKIKDKILEF